MAAILKLRRNTTASPSLTDGEIFLNYSTGTIQFASGSTPVVSNLLPLDKEITGNITGILTLGNKSTLIFLKDTMPNTIIINIEQVTKIGLLIDVLTIDIYSFVSSCSNQI